MWKIGIVILIVITALCFLPRLTSIAYGQTNGNEGKPAVQVTAAGSSAAPSAEFFGKAIGSVTPGDLFFVDAAGNPGEITLSLYITNTGELIHYLRYLTVHVAVYVEDSPGQWTKSQINGEKPPEIYLTLQNSPVTFTLPGGARYKVAIDSGCFYCLSAGNAGESIIPRFYLDTGKS
jgi:hypothetical protein